jgi:hypothetical protein
MSVDRGATFQPWSEVDEVPGVVAVSADASRFWFASYGQHLWQSRDDGRSWQNLGALPYTDTRQLAVSPLDPGVLYAVSGDGHIWVYREPDATPVQEESPEGRAACSATMPWLQLPAPSAAC